MRRILFLFFVLAVCSGILISAEGMSMEKGAVMEGTKAKAVISATSEGSAVKGEAVFVEKDGGVAVTASLSGLDQAGKHGFHIHQFGSCADGGKGAGGHFNPKGVKHGFLPQDQMEGAHFGDMGNIIVDENGKGALSEFLPGLTLTGENGIVGRAVIVHAKEDDFGQPTGNAGARVACGLIGIVSGQ